MRRCPINLKTPVDALMPSIVRNGAFFVTVKNLGWLIRNWRIVESFDVYPHPPLTEKAVLIGGKVVTVSSLQPDSYLVARLSDGRTYETGYCDLGVMKDWLARSSTLRDIPINYHQKLK